MKVQFEEPSTPNFIRTKQGLFPLKQLSHVELEVYINTWANNLREKYANTKNSKEVKK